jgi:transposase InsO family protein
MNIHSRARTTPFSRGRLAERVTLHRWRVDLAALEASVSTRTGYKWLRRFRAEGELGLRDRTSRPHRMPRQTAEEREGLIVLLRHCRMSGPAIARGLQVPRSTVARVLTRHGLGRIRSPKCAVRRYQRDRPGELIHLDVKKLARIVRIGHRITGNRRDSVEGAGWEYVHVAIDDASRIAYIEVLSDERGVTCAAFMRRAVTHYRRLGIVVERALTDNGVGYISHVFRAVCDQLAVRHLRTRPYTPQTNGKAERLIQTLLREWAYSRPYRRSRERTRALVAWLQYYNRWRPHGSLDGRPPFSRIQTPVNNLSGNYI